MCSTRSGFDIVTAEAELRVWCARLMAGIDPWITLGRGFEACLRACELPDYETFVACSDGAPRGFVRLQRRGCMGSPYVASIAVAPDWQGRGVGSALLDFAEQTYAAGSSHIFLCVSSFNTRARDFYQRRGYEFVGEVPDYILAGASELLYFKRLT